MKNDLYVNTYYVIRYHIYNFKNEPSPAPTIHSRCHIVELSNHGAAQKGHDWAPRRCFVLAMFIFIYYTVKIEPVHDQSSPLK